jgi:hypothetical protein
MEQQKSEEREKTIYLAVLNFEMAKTLASWIDGPTFLEDSSRLNAYINIAQKAGYGFVIEISRGAIFGGLTREAIKYHEMGEHGAIIFTLPGVNERRTSHKLALRIKIDDRSLILKSSQRIEATIRREDVLSLEAK